MTTSKVQHAKVEESKVNVFVDDSDVLESKFSIDKRRRPSPVSIKQSVIKLDISEEESHSRSREESSERSYHRKKSPTVQYSPTFKFSPKNGSQKPEISLHLRKVT